MLRSVIHSRPVPVSGARQEDGRGRPAGSCEDVPGSMLFCGIDPSFTNTAIVVLDSSCKLVFTRVLHAKCPKAWYERVNEILSLQHQFRRILSDVQPDIVTMEGHSYGSRFLTFAFGELGFALRSVLLGYTTYIVPPSTLKKFITGNGRADKDAIAEAVLAAVGLSFPDSHQADACMCALAGMVASGHIELGHPEALSGQRAYLGYDNPR